jgi:hypothetical protein
MIKLPPSLAPSFPSLRIDKEIYRRRILPNLSMREARFKVISKEKMMSKKGAKR